MASQNFAMSVNQGLSGKQKEGSQTLSEFAIVIGVLSIEVNMVMLSGVKQRVRKENMLQNSNSYPEHIW